MLFINISLSLKTAVSAVTEEKDLQVEEPPDSKYKLVQIIEEGSPKWPSNNVIDATLTIWLTFRKMVNSSELWRDFLIGPSLPILVELTVILVELQQSETWRYTCPGCGVMGWKILRKLSTITSNCILYYKTKNMNALSHPALIMYARLRN